MQALQISPFIAAGFHLYHRQHLLPLGAIDAEAVPHADDHFWAANGDIIPICYHIGEGKMWPNCLKYRQGRPVSRFGSWSVEIRSRLPAVLLQRECRWKCQMGLKQKKKRKLFSYLFINLSEAEGGHVGPWSPHTTLSFPTWCHMALLRGAQIAVE